jgi:hypothetical protein
MQNPTIKLVVITDTFLKYISSNGKTTTAKEKRNHKEKGLIYICPLNTVIIHIAIILSIFFLSIFNFLTPIFRISQPNLLR